MKQEYFRYALIIMFGITIFSLLLAVFFWSKLRPPQLNQAVPDLFPQVSISVEDPGQPKVSPTPPPQNQQELSTAPECKRSGCSGQICLDINAEDVITDCALRPEYVCYQQASCELQPNGQCGFTPTDELQQCLADSD